MAMTLAGCGGSRGGAHVHYYDTDNIEWLWIQAQSKDYESASATFTCLGCTEGTEGHTVEVDATVVKTTTREATCQQSGLYTYTATVTFEGRKYTDVKTREFSNPDAHNYIQDTSARYLVSAATCTEDAVYYYSCSVCHEASSETFTVAGSKLGHNLVHHNAKDSTCSEHGNVEYWECSRCHEYFLSEEGGSPVDKSEIELPLSHKMTYHPGTEISCTQSGYLPYYTCEYEPGVKYFDEAGENRVENDDDLFVPATGHKYTEDGVCANCGAHLNDELELDDPTAEDAVIPVTLSDLGIADNTQVPIHTAGHIFANYDFLANKGMDLWFKFKYGEVVQGDSQLAVYFFNQMDESGVRFRIETSRTEDDGIVYGYIIPQNQDPQWVIFPKAANIKTNSEVTLHIFAYLIDAENNTFRVGFQAGGEKMYNPVTYPGGTGYEVDSPLYTTDVELGANYFNNGGQRFLRISGIRNSSIVVSSAQTADKKIVLQNEDGKILGVKKYEEDTEITLPDIYKENHKFLGWYDTHGNKVSTVLVDKVIRAVPRFVAERENMFVPSDAGFATKDQWKSITSSSPIEESGRLNIPATSTRNDMYFVLDAVKRAENEDPYIIFGFPFDQIDQHTRVNFRINYNIHQGFYGLDGYFYGDASNSLGVADLSNYYRADNVLIDNYKLLVHLYAISTVEGSLTFTAGAEVINLGTGESFLIEKEVTSESLFSTADQARNEFCLSRIAESEGSEFRITDAF